MNKLVNKKEERLIILNWVMVWVAFSVSIIIIFRNYFLVFLPFLFLVMGIYGILGGLSCREKTRYLILKKSAIIVIWTIILNIFVLGNVLLNEKGLVLINIADMLYKNFIFVGIVEVIFILFPFVFGMSIASVSRNFVAIFNDKKVA